MAARIGFMQGRLSPQVDGKIQAFPWEHWRAEFPAAQTLGFDLMEWTLDHERIYENPFMTSAGQQEIRRLRNRYGVDIASLTGDFFMQAPFHRAQSAARGRCLRDLHAVCDACASLSVHYLVIPLVDAGRIVDKTEEADVLRTFIDMAPTLKRLHISILFESDYQPRSLVHFIDALPADAFGINYDIGNSASLGFDPEEEIGLYGARIQNVHVKDRLLGGTTVPLGTGNADFPRAFQALRRAEYQGEFILQTARATDGDHAGALRRYRDMTSRWISERQHAA